MRAEEGVEIFSVKHSLRPVGPPSKVKIPLSIEQYPSCDCRGFCGTKLVCACIAATMRNDRCQQLSVNELGSFLAPALEAQDQSILPGD